MNKVHDGKEEGARLPVAQRGEPRRSRHPRKLTCRLAPTCASPPHWPVCLRHPTRLQGTRPLRRRQRQTTFELVFIKFASSCVARSVAGITSCALIWTPSRRTRHDLSRDRSDLQARGTLLGADRVFALEVFTSLVHTRQQAHACPETLGDCE